MKVGLATPISLQLLERHIKDGGALPKGYEFPPMITLVEEYLRRGHQVSVFTTDSTTQKARAFRGGRLTIHVVPSRPRARHRVKDFFGAERAGLTAAMKNDPCDVIHAHWTYEFALAAIAGGFPHVVTAHDAPLRIVRFHSDRLYRSIRFFMALAVARKARCLTAVSPYVAEHFRKVLFYRRAIEVIPNGLPDHQFQLGSQRRRVRDERLIFATVLTGWGNLKNGTTALRAFEQVRRELPDARLLMFGRGHGKDEAAAQWARARGLDEGVEFMGSVAHPLLLQRLASEVDIFVHPSLEEAQPLSVSEAMALGLPVIGGSRSGGVPYTLEGGKGGLLVDVGDRKCLAQAMLQLARTPELSASLGRAAQESAQRRFHIEQVASAYEELYERMSK